MGVPIPAGPPASLPIHQARGARVVLEADLARLFGVEARVLNQQVRRNLERFAGYAFQLTAEEFEGLRSQIVISNTGRGGRLSPPWSFTEHGVVMAATILNSAAAIYAMRLIVEVWSSKPSAPWLSTTLAVSC